MVSRHRSGLKWKILGDTCEICARLMGDMLWSMRYAHEMCTSCGEVEHCESEECAGGMQTRDTWEICEIA